MASVTFFKVDGTFFKVKESLDLNRHSLLYIKRY